MSRKTYHRVLTIATTDSSGGAGIQADIKTIAANGCYGLSVIVALTAQNTLGVSGIHPIPTDFVDAQMDAVLSDIGADAVKIGMLFSPELIRTVAQGLVRHGMRTIVLDPVMVAQSGDRLLQDEAIDVLKTELIPLATIITPNIPEASALLGRKIATPEDVREAARELMDLGCANVLIKGGHLESGDSDDCLYLGAENRAVILSGKRIPTRNNHGTGCTLSSAIASGLAKGQTVETAVRQAKDYITQAIEGGAEYTLGQGHGPVHHFFRFF